MMRFKNFIQTITLVSMISLTGCSAMSTAISHRNLEVETKMSNTIFLEPVSPSQKTVYVEVKNTSDKPSFNINQMVKSDITAKGYKVVDDPKKAHYMLQANILQIEQMPQKEANALLSGGYGAAIGAGTAAVITHDGGATLAGGILGGLTATAADAFVKDINYAVVTDVQLSERTTTEVHESSQSTLKQGSSAVTHQSSKATSHWKRYRTRILSNADKANLDFEEAEPALEKGLANALAGLF